MKKILKNLNILLNKTEDKEIKKDLMTTIEILEKGTNNIVVNFMFLEPEDNVYRTEEFELKEEDFKTLEKGKIVLSEDFKDRTLKAMNEKYDIIGFFFRIFEVTKEIDVNFNYKCDIHIEQS